MNPLKIGVIGVGSRGVLADHAHQPANGCDIVAGADVSPAHTAKFKERFPEARTYEDYRTMLAQERLDAVFVMAPDFLHEEMAVAALRAGCAVYLEKPMAITIEGCDRVLRTAMETGSKLFIGHNMRYFPVILKMKEIIDSGLIGDSKAGWCRHFINYGGDAYFRDWHSERRNSTGLLLQKGAHDIDVMHWLMHGYTAQVSGMGMLSVYDQTVERRSPDTPGCAVWSENHWPPLVQTGMSPVIDVEDHAMILMQLDSGAQAAYLQCHYTPDAERNYTFIGTAGRIENIGDSGDCQIHVWTTRGERAKPDIIYQLKAKSGSHGGSDPDIVQGFLDFVRFDKAPNTSPVAARNAVAVGVLGHASMRGDGRREAVPPLAPALIAYFANGQKKS